MLYYATAGGSPYKEEASRTSRLSHVYDPTDEGEDQAGWIATPDPLVLSNDSLPPPPYGAEWGQRAQLLADSKGLWTPLGAVLTADFITESTYFAPNSVLQKTA